MNLNVYRVKSELEVNKKYPDLLLIPKERDKGYYTIMIEFKYLKKAKESLLKQEKEETKEQLLEYSQFEEIKNIEKLKKYTVIAIAGNDKFFIDEV